MQGDCSTYWATPAYLIAEVYIIEKPSAKTSLWRGVSSALTPLAYKTSDLPNLSYPRYLFLFLFIPLFGKETSHL